MTEIARLLAANEAYAAAHVGAAWNKPRRRLAVVTCMDARIDVYAALGLHIGDAHVLRNAGGRLTDDVLRSLALSVNVLGVDTVVLMQHTQCGLAGRTDDELRTLTGADVEFHSIDDHPEALRSDIDALAAVPYLEGLKDIAGLVYDIETGRVDQAGRWQR